MRDSKWISGLKPEMDIAKAAFLVLGVRLKPISVWLNRCIRRPFLYDEDVHQLRVSTRRAAAAVHIFSCCIPGQVHKKLKKKLSSIRKAAGPARGWDVFLKRLDHLVQNASKVALPGLDCLQVLSCSNRINAQKSLDEQHSCAENFPSLIDTVLESLQMQKGDAKFNLEFVWGQVLSQSFTDFQISLKENLTNFDQLHQVRISGKRIRYSLEIFSELLPTEINAFVYPLVEKCQEILGSVNDSYFAMSIIAKIKKRMQTKRGLWLRISPGFSLLQKAHQSNLHFRKKEFKQWLSSWEALYTNQPKLFTYAIS